MMARATGERAVSDPSETADRASATTVALAVPGMLMAEALARMLRDHGLHVVGCYPTLEALLEKIRRCRPGLVIADVDLREEPGGPADLLAQLRKAGPASKLVMLAGEVDAPFARAVMASGVSAVILKSSPTADAVGTLVQVMHGMTSFPAAVLARLGERDDPGALSRRQVEVLEQLALGRSNDEIARRLFISTNTVKFHLRVIYDRLGVHNRVEAARVLDARRSPL